MDPVVIVGGGIVGTSLAYHLRGADRPVRLLEKDVLGAGTTAASVAQFMWYQGHPHPLAHRLREAAWEEYRPLIAEGTIGFDRIGTYHAAATAEELAELDDLAADLRKCGADAEVVPPEAMAKYGFATAELEGLLSVPDDGVLDPGEIVPHYAEEARAAGIAIETGVEVTDVRTDRGAVVGVETTEGHVEAGAVVNAAGPWAPRVNAFVGVDLPLRHTRGPIIVLETGREVALPLTLLPDDYYVREEGPSGVLVGNFATDYEGATRLDPDAAHPIGEEVYLGAAESLVAYLPEVADADVINGWMGIRTVTPDGFPYVGETAVEGYHVACGMSGYGVTLSPAVGRLLAAYLMGGEEGELLSFLSPDRAD